ncbi:phosphatidylserine decarboxylase precursor [Thioflavicoccus mobilis 8321]|uniref:Phosphatidylserine decarboxylase proenzyme n=1 Tax=Thioflavicoccus mobilis 8321 TaxID=765912 RepID=L0GYS4_9GAMM|nr:archaetidylserine decarboxylase [Thioflavicoccus mobilis]AGA90967.1 phosphatidylserine decarboxylase precursor [Thioflavicoccus mobilis 8321]
MTADPSPRWPQRLSVLGQRLLPHHTVAALMYRLARSEWPPIKRALVGGFRRFFDIDLSEAQNPDPTAYPSFNAFFTRALRPEARPLRPDAALLCPADGRLSQQGPITDGRLYQAKGHDFSLAELLGSDEPLATEFTGGSFATIYLSPRDYHRVHMPLAGTLRVMNHVPGRLFSVNDASTRLIPRLFARNERVISVFDTAIGPLAVILVGAFFVGSIETVWAGQVTPTARHRVGHRDYRETRPPVRLARGAEMGRFNMGSTVILLLPAGAVRWVEGLAPGMVLRMGQPLGRLATPDETA